jgi:integrase
VKLSERLGRRRQELEHGAVRATGTTLKEAEARFYASLVKKRERTRETYREGTDRLLHWAGGAGLRTCDDLTRGKVIAFREWLLAEDVAPATFNKWLRAVKRMLGYWIDADLCPKLDYADLRRIKQEDAPTELREFLTPAKVRKLLKAAERHDATTYSMTRREKAAGMKNGTPRYQPVSPFVLFVLLTGCRLSEALGLRWRDVDLGALDHSGNPVGQFQIRAADSKTKKPRTVTLGVSPALRRLLAAQRLRTAGRGLVWPGMTEDVAKDSMDRLRVTYGAPPTFTWQALRRTCSTFLVNSPGVFGSASAYLAARQLGHGVSVMERNYSGLAHGIDPSLRNLESVLAIEDDADRIVRAVSEAPKPLRAAAAG